MKIKILSLLDGAKKATGLTVVIDVFRAFSTSCYLFSNGARKIIPVKKVREARILKKNNPGYILVGERNGRKLEGFEFHNSPSRLVSNDFSGETIVLTTTAGTKGLTAARNADEVITGSLVNLDAVTHYIKKREPEEVSIVPMGKGAEKPSDEDELCARWIRKKLLGEKIENPQAEIDVLKSGDGKRFFKEKNQDWSPKQDFYLCTDLNRFDFVLRASFTEEEMVLNKIKCSK